MEINRDQINKLLSLNDRQLMSVIQSLIKESGIDPSQFGVNTGSIESIRSTLRSAMDEDLKLIAEQYESAKRSR